MNYRIRLKGGAGSGFHGHRGRPGQEGGSLPRGVSNSSIDRYAWASNIATSPIMKKLLDKYGNIDFNHTELADLMQTNFPYADMTKQEFVAHIKNLTSSAEQLPKAKKPVGNRWVWETEDGKMPPEIMYYLKQHYAEHGSGSQIVTPQEILKYSNGFLDERTLDHIYSESLRPYFNWEHMANLNQLRLKNEYVYSEEGISSKNARLGKSLKFIGLTPAQLYDELMRLKP